MAFTRHVAAAGVLALLAAGCSSASGPLTRSGPPASASSATATAPATTAGGTPSTTASGTKQQVTVTPATGLKSTQTVVVQASGFSAGESLVVTQCAAKGTATGPGDCNLTGMQNVTADASGRVSVGFMVLKGPFGANKILCGAAQACLISVTQATLSPTEEADAPISFRLARGA
jgi:hypothetical protein